MLGISAEELVQAYAALGFTRMPDEGAAMKFEKDNEVYFHNCHIMGDRRLLEPAFLIQDVACWNPELASRLSEQIKQMIGFR